MNILKAIMVGAIVMLPLCAIGGCSKTYVCVCDCKCCKCGKCCKHCCCHKHGPDCCHSDCCHDHDQCPDCGKKDK